MQFFKIRPRRLQCYRVLTNGDQGLHLDSPWHKLADPLSIIWTPKTVRLPSQHRGQIRHQCSLCEAIFPLARILFNRSSSPGHFSRQVLHSLLDPPPILLFIHFRLLSKYSPLVLSCFIFRHEGLPSVGATAGREAQQRGQLLE